MTTDRDFDVAAYQRGLEEGRREAAAYIEEASRLRVRIVKMRMIIRRVAQELVKEIDLD